MSLKIGFLGGGKMAQALARGFLAKGAYECTSADSRAPKFIRHNQVVYWLLVNTSFAESDGQNGVLEMHRLNRT